MRIFDAVERMPVSIPISELMGAGGSFEFLSEIKNKGYFDVDYRKNELILVAGKYIGQIPLTDKIAIHVHPKVPIGNLARIIGVANHPIRCLNFFRRKYKLDGNASQSLLEAMARSLVASLYELNAEGIYREYTLRNKSLTSLRGRIDLPAFVQYSVPRIHNTNVRCNYYELSTDTVFNRVIKRAIHTIGLILAEGAQPDKKLIRELAYFSDHFDSVPLDNSTRLVNQVKDQLLNHRIPDLRRYYLDILDVCCLILEGSGIELMEQSGGNNLHSLIVNLEDAFEQYIREILVKADVIGNANLSVLDGNKEGMSSLFYDNDAFDAKPDLVIGPLGSVCAIGDVKYKTKIAENDRYQLISHSLSYGAKNAFIVAPAPDEKNIGPVYIGSIGETNPIKVFHYRFDLESESLQASEESFIDWVAGLAE